MDTNTDSTAVTDNWDGGLTATLIFSGFLFMVIMPIWLYWRRKFPRIYYSRKRDDPNQDTWFKWIKPCLSLRSFPLLYHTGIEGFLFLEWKEISMAFLTFISILGVGVLIPTDVSQADFSVDTIFNSATASVLPLNSNLSWLIFVYECIISLAFLLLLFIHRKRYFHVKKHNEQRGGGYLLVAELTGIPKTCLDEKEIKDLIEEKLNKKIESVSIVWKGSSAISAQKKRLKYLGRLQSYNKMYEETKTRPMFRPIYKDKIPGILMCYCSKIDAIDYYEKKYNKANAKLLKSREEALEDKKHGKRAFVVFSNFKTREYVINNWDKICSKDSELDSHNWEFQCAHPVEEIYWKHLNVQTPRRLGIQLSGTLFILILALFWTIPTTFLSNLESLSDIPAFGEFIEDILPENASYIVFYLLSDLVPVLLQLALFSFIPYICLYISKPENHTTRSDLYASAMVKYWIFIIFNSYIFYLLFSSGADLATALFLDPGEFSQAFEQLDWDLYGAFYCNYLITLALYDSIFTFLRIRKLLKKYMFRYFARHSTEEEKDRVFAPRQYKYFVYFAKETVYFAMIMTFAPIVPLVSVCGVLAYFMTYISHKNAIVLFSARDTGGGRKMLLRFAVFICISYILSILFWIFFFVVQGPQEILYAAVPCFLIFAATSIIILSASTYYERFASTNATAMDEISPFSEGNNEIEDVSKSYSWVYITNPEREVSDPGMEELLR